MHTRDLLAELALMHRRVEALLNCIARLHQKSAAQQQGIAHLTEAVREAEEEIALLAEGLAQHSVTWAGTTCPACLETREEEKA